LWMQPAVAAPRRSKRVAREDASLELSGDGPGGRPMGQATAPHFEMGGLASGSAAMASIDPRVERCRQLGRKNSKSAKHLNLRGAAKSKAESKKASSGLWYGPSAAGSTAAPIVAETTAASTVKHFGTNHMVIINDVLPGAAQMLAEERAAGSLTKVRGGGIRNIPVALEHESELTKATRNAWKFSTRSRLSEVLNKRLEPLRRMLHVCMVERVALESTKPVGNSLGTPRQVGHFDYNQVVSSSWEQQSNPKARPWTLLVCLQPGGKILVLVGGRWVMVRLAEGQGVLFRYDVWHGGAYYDKEHWRLHEYWEPVWQ